MKAISNIIAAIAIIFTFGCATTSEPTSQELRAYRIEKAVKAVVRTGSITDLLENPAHRPKYESASAALNSLVEQQRWDGSALTVALIATGNKTFENPTMILAVAGGLELFDAVTGETVDLSQQAYLAPAIRGAAAGVSEALSVTKPQPIPAQDKAGGNTGTTQKNEVKAIPLFAPNAAAMSNANQPKQKPRRFYRKDVSVACPEKAPEFPLEGSLRVGSASVNAVACFSSEWLTEDGYPANLPLPRGRMIENPGCLPTYEETLE